MIKSSWSEHKELKSLPIPTAQDMLDKAREIDRQDIQALFCLLFVSGARLSEILGNRKGPKTWLGLMLRNITIEKDAETGEDFLVIKLHCCKRRRVKEKVLQIPIAKEKEMMDLIDPFLSLPCFSRQPTDQEPFPDELFRMDRRYAYKLIKKATGYNPHFIRVCRCTDLVVRYSLNDAELTQFMGWSNSVPAVEYVRLRTGNMRRAMLKTP